MKKVDLTKIDVLIPAYNEALRIGNVLEVLSHSNFVAKIIVIDDGSKDRTAEIAKSFLKVKCIRLNKNIGKGGALKEGLKMVTSNYVFLCDADLIGLKEGNIKDMVTTSNNNPKALVVGLKQKSKCMLLHKFRASVLPLIAGERIIEKTHLEKILSYKASSHYGIEVYTNYYFKKHRLPIIKILLDGVNDIPKYKKEGHGFFDFVSEAFHITFKYISIYSKGFFKKILIKNSKTVNNEDLSVYKNHKVNVKGCKINFYTIGKGQEILFLHGMANNWKCFKPLANYLSKNHKLFLVDLPGYGDSEHLNSYSVSKMSKYIKYFIKKLNLNPLSVVGLSMGSAVVADLVKKFPKATKSAVIMSPVLEDKKRKVFLMKYIVKTFRRIPKGSSLLKVIMETKTSGYFLAKFVNMHKFNKELIDKYGYEGKKKMTKEAYVQMAISIAEYNLNKTLEKVKKPTLLIYGEKDKVSSFTYAQKTVLGQNKNLSLTTVPDAGHVVSLEKPEDTAKAIDSFLRELV